MSYDLCFWRATSIHCDAPDVVCSRLDNDEELTGMIAFLPVANIKIRFKDVFPDIEDCNNELRWDGAVGSFRVGWSITSKPGQTLAIFVACSYDLLKNPEILNRIIEVANEFGCALYDPQSGERYEQPTIPQSPNEAMHQSRHPPA